MPRTYNNEHDFAARYLIPRFAEAKRVLDVSESIDIVYQKPLNGIPDITVSKGGKGLFVLEAKFKKKVGKVKRDIEPRDPEVIKQAVHYAEWGGFPYYLTCNAKRIVLFKRDPRVPMLQSEIASFEYESTPDWAEEILKLTLEIIPVSLKPLDDTLVDTLHEAYIDLYPEFLSTLKERLKGKKFREKYIDWLESQGLELNDEHNRLIAEQSTYLQLNKLLFYQVIREVYPDKLGKLEIQEDEDVQDVLNRFYSEARRIDYAPIYEGDIISDIPFTERAKERFRTLIDTLNGFDFSQMESDFIGRVYEKLISPLERKRLGQFYTPPRIVDFIIRLTLNDPHAKVLDPGCGSGSFLVRAYHKIRELNGIPKSMSGAMGERFHQQILEQIYGVDINQFPAHLSVINLAVQNAKARIDKVNVIVSDIFDIKAGQATLSGFSSITAEGKPTYVELPPSFDVIVANPPYIRQELLGAKEKQKIKLLIESDIEKVFIGKPSKKVKDATILDKQSDIYIYFFIQGIRLLKNGGHLGFISSNKWLEVGYGEPFQRFLLEHTRILYVIEFDRAIFPDAEVNTAITILEKESDRRKRQNNLVRFIRIKKKTSLDEQVRLIQETEESIEDERIRINIVKQDDLTEGKWNVHLRAPPVYQKVIHHPKVKPLGDIAEVFFGIKTGYNEYFIISKERAKEWNIEKEFLKPVVTSPKKIKGLDIRSEHLDEYLFLCHKPKKELKGTNALKYIEYGERVKVKIQRTAHPIEVPLPEVPSVTGRKLWYDLPEYEVPPIIFQELYDTKTRALWNKAKAHGRAPLYYCIPRPNVDVKLIVSYLNTSLAQMLLELYGRSYGGGVLDVKVYELKKLPTIETSRLENSKRDRMTRAFDALVEAVDMRVKVEDDFTKVKSKDKESIGILETEVRKRLDDALRMERQAQRELDEAVYDALGLSKIERLQVERALTELQELRRLRTKV